MPKELYVTTAEAVALNMAAKHGSKVSDELREYFLTCDNDYVKNVGTILIEEKAYEGDPYFPAAKKLAEEVTTKEPLRIAVLPAGSFPSNRRAGAKPTARQAARRKVASPYSLRFARPARV